jgi:hypothetical protein
MGIAIMARPEQAEAGFLKRRKIPQPILEFNPLFR